RPGSLASAQVCRSLFGDRRRLEDRDRFLDLPGGPDQAAAGQDDRGADAQEEGGEPEAELQQLSRRRTDAELRDERIRGASPRLLANRCIDRVLSVERGPVAA